MKPHLTISSFFHQASEYLCREHVTSNTFLGKPAKVVGTQNPNKHTYIRQPQRGKHIAQQLSLRHRPQCFLNDSLYCQPGAGCLFQLLGASLP